jgi:photosystem II stability/assembly factor-like uncharacterized protein
MKRTLFLILGVAILLGLSASPTSQAGAEAWQPVPGPLGGSVAALALSPDYAADRTLFAGFRARGIYRTTNGGIFWQLSSPGDWVVTSLALSPAYADDQTLFASHGLWTSGYDVHRSTDGGDSWQEVSPAWSSLPNPPGLAISPDYAADETLYVLGGSRTYHSTNGGDSFVELAGWFASHAVAKLAFSPAFATDRTLFALVPGEGLFKSTDGGTAWGPTGLAGNVSTFAVSPDYASDKMLLAVTEGDGQLRLSTDGGDHWSPATQALDPAGPHVLLFSSTFASDRTILAASPGDPGPYRSEDGGTTWTPSGEVPGSAIQALALAPDDASDATAFAGTSTGLFHSSNRGVNWYQGRGPGLPRLTIRSLATAPGPWEGAPPILLAGTSLFEHLRVDTAVPEEYNGSLQLSTDGGQNWQATSGLLDRVQNVVVSPDYVNDQIAFAATGTLGQHGYADGGVYRSTDGGRSWTEVLANRICHALALSPAFATDHTLWVAPSTYSENLGLQVSSDGGDSWAPLAPGIHAQVLAPSPEYALDRTLFAGTLDSGLQRSGDGGSIWDQVLDRPITALAISPAYAASRTLYAGVKPAADAPGEIWRSTDGGETWARSDTGIPGTADGEAATLSALHFAPDGSVLAGLYYGSEEEGGAVYRSTDGGDTWQALGSGLEPAGVFALGTMPGGSWTGYAGTGSGLWELEVSQGGPAEPGTWTSNGPRGGRALTLGVSPDFASDGLALTGEHLYGRHGEEYGLGIFRSTDGGQTWQPSATGTEETWSASAVHDFAFSPGFAADGTVFAATWGGLFKSTNGADSWEWIFFGWPGSITAVAVAPDYVDSGHVLAASGWGGLYLSEDGGRRWTLDASLMVGSDVAYSPDFATDRTAFAGGAGLYRTENAGLDWTQVLTEGVAALAISPEFGSDGTVFAASSALYTSHDGGTTWISTTLPTDPPYITALAISPGFGTDGTLFAGTSGGLLRSSDGGLSWEPVPNYPGLPVRALAISPGWPGHPVLLVGTDLGVYRTADGGATWTRAPGLITPSAEPLALSSGEDLLVAGTNGHGIHGTSDGGASWSPLGLQQLRGSRIVELVISADYVHDGTMYALAAGNFTMGTSLYRTTDSGTTWELIYSTGYTSGLALSPQFGTDRTVFLTPGAWQVLRSLDGGDNWDPVGEWPAGIYDAASFVALPPNYPADSTLFAGGSKGFWRLPPGATTWERPASGLGEDRGVGVIAVSPAYAADQTLLAAAGWREEPLGPDHHSVYRSTDGGVNWEQANTGLPDEEAEAIAFSPHFASDRTAYLVLDGQLYRSRDGGLHWTAVGAPAATYALYDLVVEGDGDVYVSSNLGVWRYRTPAQDILINGGFEAPSGWESPITPRPAGFTERVVYDGGQSLRVGIAGGANVFAYSSARQVVTIPADALTATLACHIYPVSGEALQVTPEQAFPSGLVPGSQPQVQAAAGDGQYLLLLDPDTGRILETLFWELTNEQAWQERSFDLTAYAGQTLKLHFGVYNDGAGGRTALFVDNASLLVWHPAWEGYRQHLPLVFRGSG